MKIGKMCLIALWIVLSLCAVQGKDAAEVAKEILRASGVKGGIVVHLGCGDGEVTAALRASDSYTVQGLEPDAALVQKARAYIHGLGVYGDVSVVRLSGKRLPYADNLVNLVVVEDPDLVPAAEVTRVLAPEGVAYIRVKGTQAWKRSVKPRPDEIDEWSHFLHDAGNNAVARDSVVGPPRLLQWVGAPLWLRSHETPSGFQAQVSSGGRLFYIFDEGLIGITDERLPDRWSIVSRDAFNGKLLWKRKIDPWGWREWALKYWQGKDWTVVRAGRVQVPDGNQCRLVARGDRLYATLGYYAPLSILDAATGEVIKTIKGTEGTNEILASDGIVVVRVERAEPESEERRGKEASEPTRLVAIDGKTGDQLWEAKTSALRDLFMAIEGGRVIYLSGAKLVCLNLKNGEECWQVTPALKGASTLVVNDGIVLLKGKGSLEALDAVKGKSLWNKKVMGDSGAASVDLFVANGLVWTGMTSVDKDLKPARKAATAMAIGLDPRTGNEIKRVVASELRSPEHHHRCYRNKATDRFIISAMEGLEFMDLQSDGHSQNNWLRGACRLGVMPCNGMLYVPPDQCFCEPGSKLLGLAAVGPETTKPRKPISDGKRLSKGPAYGKVKNAESANGTSSDWPSFRHGPARGGSTQTKVPTPVDSEWRTQIGGKLTAPVAAEGKIFVAASDAHTLHALSAATGKRVWQFTAGGRIDSPPTIHEGMAIFGSMDGHVYCLRASDGALVWEFMAAPSERQIAYFGQVESAWPVHGSVLISNGVAYFGAGRSTYLDGGIRLYGLDPKTGKILHKGLLEGPYPEVTDERDHSFYTTGANSDLLVAEGGSIYMRQKRLTPELKEIKGEILSSKGEMDVGLHVFSTSGLLDGSWYNRTFWMYSKRWPGFQLANQAPKSGQLLVIDDKVTYGVKVFYRRNTHTTMFFPGKEGYLLFADANTNEPQIVGEEGARKPLKWLPQSDYNFGNGKGMRKLDTPAFGTDKGIGYTRAEPPLWTQWVHVRVRAMVKTQEVLFVAGPPDVYDEKDPFAAFEGRAGARLAAVSAKTGQVLLETDLSSPPVFDGMIAANGHLFLSLRDGSLLCMGEKGSRMALGE